MRRALAGHGLVALIAERMEIETLPLGATLYVNGNRARNPYRQDLAPGPVEIFAEAPDQNYLSRTEEFTLEPGQRKQLTGPSSYRLQYVQRSGKPELIAASAVLQPAAAEAARGSIPPITLIGAGPRSCRAPARPSSSS